MALTGDLSTFDFLELLEWIARKRRTGTLVLRRLSTEKRLGFRDGQLRSSSSNDPRETLGQVLVRDQLLGEEELFKALLRQEKEHRLLGELLVADGRLTPDQLRRALESKTEETLYDLFLWPDGRFEFEDGPAPPEGPVRIDMDLHLVLQEGLHRLKQWRELRPQLPSTATFQVQRRGADVQDPIDQQLLGLAAGGKTLAAISLETRRAEFEITLRLHALIQRGALRVGTSQPQEAPLDPVGAMHALLARAKKMLADRNFDGALQAYEAVLGIDRLNQEAKKGLLAVGDARRQWRVLNRLPLDKVPVLRVGSMALTQQHFEPDEGFVLSRINGQWSLRAILKLCPMPETDALAIFGRLIDRGVVGLVEGSGGE
jgi:hypothetical protein